MSPDGEFCCCHLVFGAFRPRIHVFWGPMDKKLRISENEDYIRYVVLIFGNSWTWWEHYVLREEDSMYFSFLEIRENHVVIIFGYSWNPRTIDLFLRPKMCSREVFFCFPVQNFYWQVRFAKIFDLGNWGPRSTVCNLHPPHGVITLCAISIPR